jgi:hypothetical protein
VPENPLTPVFLEHTSGYFLRILVRSTKYAREKPEKRYRITPGCTIL